MEDDVIVLSDSEDSVIISDSDDSAVVVNNTESIPAEQTSSSSCTTVTPVLTFCTGNVDFYILHAIHSTTEIDGFIKGVPECYSNDPSMPIFERIPPSRKRLYLIEDNVRLLLHPPLEVHFYLCSHIGM